MTFSCIFFQFLGGKCSWPMAMLDNFMCYVGRSRIAGSVDYATGNFNSFYVFSYILSFLAFYKVINEKRHDPPNLELSVQ